MVQKTETCWLWVGGTNGSGYGRFCVDGRLRVYPHRYAYEQLVGPIPERMTLDHLCRVRLCCRPDHLEVVTRSENIRRGTVGQVNAARMRSRTHCPQGHPYDEANTYIDPTRGVRACRICMKERARVYRERRNRRSP
jgi:hypothetical protein